MFLIEYAHRIPDYNFTLLFFVHGFFMYPKAKEFYCIDNEIIVVIFDSDVLFSSVWNSAC